MSTIFAHIQNQKTESISKKIPTALLFMCHAVFSMNLKIISHVYWFSNWFMICEIWPVALTLFEKRQKWKVFFHGPMDMDSKFSQSKDPGVILLYRSVIMLTSRLWHPRWTQSESRGSNAPAPLWLKRKHGSGAVSLGIILFPLFWMSFLFSPPKYHVYK